MSSLPPITRQIIEEYSAHVPTQAKFLAQMSANSAFITASVHHYISPFDSSSAERPNVFKYSEGSEECFDADVVRLVAQILNDRSDFGHQHALGWEVILAQLQQCLVTLSGTYFTSVSISSAAQSSSQLCRYLNSCNKTCQPFTFVAGIGIARVCQPPREIGHNSSSYHFPTKNFHPSSQAHFSISSPSPTFKGPTLTKFVFDCTPLLLECSCSGCAVV